MCRTLAEAAAHLEATFPRLKTEGYRITSNLDTSHNCVAWAACRDVAAYWEPSRKSGKFWPADVPLTDTLDAFARVFAWLGYERCDSDAPEPGVEKVALYWYQDEEEFSHVAHQQEDGTWTSKLGALEDIEHRTLTALYGPPPAYGSVARFMKRPRQSSAEKPTKEPELIDAPPDTKLERFDDLFRNVVSASNVMVQTKIKAEKRKRQRRKTRRAR
jgi:hypothetical protein